MSANKHGIKYELPFNPFLHIYDHFNTLKKKGLGKHCWKKVKLLKMSNFTFFHNVFYAICVLKFFNSHISFVICSFFEFGTVSKWCIIPFPNKPWFLHVCNTSLLKILWEKEKLLVTISPFPTVFSTVLESFVPFSSNLKLLSATSCSFEESKICRLGKG